MENRPFFGKIYHLAESACSTTIPLAMKETQDQFSLSRAALSTLGRRTQFLISQAR